MNTVLQMVFDNYTGQEREMLVRAYHYAEKAHEGRVAGDQHSPFAHSREIVLALGGKHADVSLFSAAERRVAEQWSTRINECYELLRNPVARGAWLCEAAGCSVEAETRTSMPADFLVEQLEKREALESVDDAESARRFLEMAEADFGRLTEETARAIDDRRDWPTAVDSVRRLMFAERLLTEARRRLAALAAQP